jgi:signal peptide peptidase SppA
MHEPELTLTQSTPVVPETLISGSRLIELDKNARLGLAIQLFLGEQWALQEEKFNQILALVQHRLLEAKPRPDEFQALSESKTPFSTGNIAVIPVSGVLSYRANMFSNSSGGTSIETLQKVFKNAIEDPSISSIVLNIDSPGGSVSGTKEFADEIYKSRSQKKTYAIANPTAASAAFWIGSAANKFYGLGSGQVGSVGVYSIYTESQIADEKSGYKYHIVKAGEFKGEGAVGEPMTDSMRNHMQQIVDGYYSDFVNSLAQYRNTSVKRVNSDFGKGRMMRSTDAVNAGMLDDVMTLNDLLTSIQKKQAVSQRRDQLKAKYHLDGAIS